MSPSPSEPRDSRARIQREWGRYAGLGLQFAASVLVLALGGYWLDRRMGTLPLFLIVGVLLGFIGGTVAIVKQVPPPTGSRSRDPHE